MSQATANVRRNCPWTVAWDRAARHACVIADMAFIGARIIANGFPAARQVVHDLQAILNRRDAEQRPAEGNLTGRNHSGRTNRAVWRPTYQATS